MNKISDRKLDYLDCKRARQHTGRPTELIQIPSRLEPLWYRNKAAACFNRYGTLISRAHAMSCRVTLFFSYRVQSQL